MRHLKEDLLEVLPDHPDIKINSHDGFLKVDILWGDYKKARLDVYSNKVWWHSLRAPESESGLYTLFCEEMPKIFSKYGIEYFEMTVDDPKWKEVYLKRGNWQPANVEYAPGQTVSGFRWDIRNAAE